MWSEGWVNGQKATSSQRAWHQKDRWVPHLLRSNRWENANVEIFRQRKPERKNSNPDYQPLNSPRLQNPNLLTHSPNSTPPSPNFVTALSASPASALSTANSRGSPA